MNKQGLILLSVLAVILAACGPTAVPPAPEVITTQPASEATAPVPPPTEVPVAKSKPGGTYAGLIQMGDKATMATINLTISPEGDKITKVGVAFSDLKCDDFEVSTMITTDEAGFQLSEGKFQISSGKIGAISGEFTSPGEVAGTVDLNIDLGMVGKFACGKWDWSASQVLETLEKETPPAAADLASPTLPPAPTEPAAGPMPSGDVAAINVSGGTYKEAAFIYGEVENRLSQTIWVDQIDVKLYAAGDLVGEDQGYAYPDICLPGERVPFDVYLPDAPAFDEFKLEVVWEPSDEAPFDGVGVITEVVKQVGIEDEVHVYGLVKNELDTNVELADVFAVFYDEQGTVLRVARYPVSSPGDILKPGEVAPFGGFVWPPLTEYASYRLVVVGYPTEVPQPPPLEISDVVETADQLAGKVKYTGPGVANYPFVIAVFYDQDGKIVSMGTGSVEPDKIASGETGSFDMPIYFEYDHYEFYTQYSLE